jgi:hypothetical protein
LTQECSSVLPLSLACTVACCRRLDLQVLRQLAELRLQVQVRLLLLLWGAQA